MASIAAMTTGIEIGGIAGDVGAEMVMGGIAGGGADSFRGGDDRLARRGDLRDGDCGRLGHQGRRRRQRRARRRRRRGCHGGGDARNRRSGSGRVARSVVLAGHGPLSAVSTIAGLAAEVVSTAIVGSVATLPRLRRQGSQRRAHSGWTHQRLRSPDSARRRRHLGNGHGRGRDDGPLDLRPGARHLHRGRRARTSDRRNRGDYCDDAGSHQEAARGLHGANPPNTSPGMSRHRRYLGSRVR